MVVSYGLILAGEALEFWTRFIYDNGIAKHDAITDAVSDTSTDAA